jgi:hypothetical protein
VARKTFGFHKESDKISGSQFEEALGINRRNLDKVLFPLEAMGILQVERAEVRGRKHINTYSLKCISQDAYNKDKKMHLPKQENASSGIDKMHLPGCTQKIVQKIDTKESSAAANPFSSEDKDKPSIKERTLAIELGMKPEHVDSEFLAWKGKRGEYKGIGWKKWCEKYKPEFHQSTTSHPVYKPLDARPPASEGRLLPDSFYIDGVVTEDVRRLLHLGEKEGKKAFEWIKAFVAEQRAMGTRSTDWNDTIRRAAREEGQGTSFREGAK